MGVEIEKKFLVDVEKLPNFEKEEEIKQGYINTVGNTVVRVRIKGEKAFITVKGEVSGTTRSEYEYEIPLDDGNEMLETLCDKKILKTRKYFSIDKHLWEVDFFKGDNEGLIVAEIELEDENETFTIHDWITKEVSNDYRYFNNNLIEKPFNKWDRFDY